MKKYASLKNYEDFKAITPEQDKTHPWVRELFNWMFSKDYNIPRRSTAQIPQDAKLEFFKEENYKKIKFYNNTLESGFWDFITYYTTDFKTLYNGEKAKSTKSKVFFKLSSILLNSLITPSSTLLKAITEKSLEQLKQQKEVFKLYIEYKKAENIKLSHYDHIKDVFIQWRTLPLDNKKINELRVVYNNFISTTENHILPVSRSVLLTGGDDNLDILPTPLKVILTKQNYIVILDDKGNISKLNDFIDDKDFKQVHKIFSFNLWDLDFDNKYIKISKDLKTKLELLQKEKQYKIKEQKRLKEQEANILQLSNSVKYFEYFDTTTRQTIKLNKNEAKEKVQQDINQITTDIQNIEQRIEEIRNSQTDDDNTDTRVKPPHYRI
ncbi:hypothetical protein [Mycoplasmopsis verecunda]|uniref:Uncharacterized protein n=1 Tax=Mycoplasmopsis verecunda TaxID=171291 RepID=A0A1T4KS48_9BACT|nr:hypothetical protein [Mycoplasmopsis verecunda]WPB54681.1 hypothetical protein SAM46_00765 [Mycoplasmopsis verecunda]SJZ45180.1 hypothetical protein SAMN02745154_00151 [Mycoplasmopsis verecunda]